MPTDNKEWASDWPTTLDWNFNFYKLLKADGKNSPIGSLKKTLDKVDRTAPFRVAIVGAGVSGLLAARELVKAGCGEIDIYEASERIGGRTYSVKAKGQRTTYELGAMRIPFFDTLEGGNVDHDGKFLGSKNCILDYLREIFDISIMDFPVPGSDNCYTGLYLRDSELSEKPNDIHIFKKGRQVDGGSSTGNLEEIIKRWENFSKTFRETVREKYEKSTLNEWKRYWAKIVKNYHEKDFRQLVFEKNLTEEYIKNPQAKLSDNSDRTIEQCFKEDGNFGGLGLINKDATTFFTVGAGDGGWGAFYDISSLYVIRVLLGGYGAHQKLVKGHDFDSRVGFKHPVLDNTAITDSADNQLARPNFLGVQSFAECLFFNEITFEEDGEIVTRKSIYDLSKNKGTKPEDPRVRFYIHEPVQEVHRRDEKSPIKLASKNFRREYDAVVLSTPTWAAQVNMNLRFPSTYDSSDKMGVLPATVRQSMKFSHWIHSCKLFFPLKERFWDKKEFCTPPFPQAILTDTFIQDVYLYAADEKDPGVLLASYTWEDNAMKMLGFKNDQELADACLRKLDGIFMKSQFRTSDNKPILISDYVNRDNPVIIQWSKLPNYAGCAKLYRQNNEVENSHLLDYNRDYSARSNLYFAGEAYSLEGGWIEPALRLAIDAVIHLINNNGVLRDGFKYETYEALTRTKGYLNEDYLYNGKEYFGS
jgi:monoamine oxidase